MRDDMPHVYLDIKIQPFQGDILHADPTKWNIITGRLVIELFEDIVPVCRLSVVKTSDTACSALSEITSHSLKVTTGASSNISEGAVCIPVIVLLLISCCVPTCSVFHRIMPKFMCQGVFFVLAVQ